jgi:histidine phosphotransfer protein HptB
MSTEESAPVFDRESVLDMVDGDVEFMLELIEMFLADLPTYHESIHTAVANGDAAALQQVTHRMKSSVGNLGGREAQAAVMQLESAARNCDLENAASLLRGCQEKIDRFGAKLTSVLNEG